MYIESEGAFLFLMFVASAVGGFLGVMIGLVVFT